MLQTSTAALAGSRVEVTVNRKLSPLKAMAATEVRDDEMTPHRYEKSSLRPQQYCAVTFTLQLNSCGLPKAGLLATQRSNRILWKQGLV